MHGYGYAELTATLFTHAETPAQLPLPDVPVLVGDACVVVEDAFEVVEDAFVVVDVTFCVVVVVGEGDVETGHVCPRTVVIHEEVASGYYQTDMSDTARPETRYKCKRNHLPNHDTSVCTDRPWSAFCDFQGYK